MWCARHAGKRSLPKMHAFSKWLCSKRALLFRNAPFQTCAPFPKRSFPNGGAASRRAVDGGPSAAGMAVAGRLRTPARTRRAADSDNARHQDSSWRRSQRAANGTGAIYSAALWCPSPARPLAQPSRLRFKVQAGGSPLARSKVLTTSITRLPPPSSLAAHTPELSCLRVAKLVHGPRP